MPLPGSLLPLVMQAYCSLQQPVVETQQSQFLHSYFVPPSTQSSGQWESVRHSPPDSKQHLPLPVGGSKEKGYGTVVDVVPVPPVINVAAAMIRMEKYIILGRTGGKAVLR